MGAIFGVIGSVSQSEATEMGRRLAHRGHTVHSTRLESAATDPGGVGILGSIGGSHDSNIRVRAEVALTCTGSLYNADILVDRLRRENHPIPESLALADLLIASYKAWGAEAIEHMDGDFAFVIVDRLRNEILFGRDFFGCCPLYYSVLPAGGIAFASEYKAILALSAIKPEPDLDMVQYLQYAKRLPVGRTLVKNVLAPPPGAIVALDGRGVEKHRHAMRGLRVDVTVRDENAASELIVADFERAIRRRARDVSCIGLALSGGIDSIGTAFLMRKAFPDKPMLTFTAGSRSDDPEIRTAARAAKLLGSTHHEVITPASLLRSDLPKLAWHLEDPYARTEALQLMKVAQAAAGKVDVLFSAQGADGLFAGTPKYMLLALMERLPPLRSGLREFYNYTQLGLPPRRLMGRAIAWAKYRGRLPMVPRVRGASPPKPIEFPPIAPEFINTMMSRSFQSGMCQSIQKFERTFAASGLVYRSPFYDVDFCRSAYTITDDLKIRGWNQKYILRRAFESVVPAEFLEIKKFPQQMQADTGFCDAIDAVTDSALGEAALQRRGFFDPADIHAARASRGKGRYDMEAAMRLWTAVLTELWALAFIDQRGARPATLDDAAPEAYREVHAVA